jgi:hypothetical protein
MLLPAVRCGSFIALLAVLGLSARTIWSQRLGAEEFSRHANTAIDELLDRRLADPDTVNRVRKSFLLPGGDLSSKTQARNRLFESLKQHDFSLVRDGKGFEALPKTSVRLNDQLALKTSGEFVDSIWSVIRRLSILDNIGPHTSTELDHDQLREYLKSRSTMSDYAQVTDSFNPSLKTEVVAFQKPTTLLRLYGGTTNASGRYFFCCLMRLARFPDGRGHSTLMKTRAPLPWADASDLATPPDNLLNHLAVATIPAGTTAIVGTVADNFLNKLGNAERGGNTQIFIPEVNTFPFEEYRLSGLVPNRVTEIALQSDDRILRFRRSLR